MEPLISKEDVAAFFGTSVEELDPFTPTALIQATLLFKLATCRTELPTDPLQLEIAKAALAALVDTLNKGNKYDAIISSPYASETIGSYSYSKGAWNVVNGHAHGIPWFDMAVKELSLCHLKDDGFGGDIPMSGGIQVFPVYERTTHTGTMGFYRLLPDYEKALSAEWGFDPFGK